MYKNNHTFSPEKKHINKSKGHAFKWFLVLMFLTMLMWTGTSWLYMQSTKENAKLVRDNHRLKDNLVKLNTKFDMLNMSYSRIATLADKMKSISGLYDKSRNISIGPLSKEEVYRRDNDLYYMMNMGAEPNPDNTAKNMLNNSSIDKTERELSFLYDFFRNKQLVLSSYPSIKPTTGWITSGFGERHDPFTGTTTFHEGLDISAPIGTPIHATADGVIVFSGMKEGYGKTIIIDHGFGISTRYAHCSVLYSEPGEKVKRHQTIALVGNTGRTTGPHLHYEIRLNDVPNNPMKFIIH